MSFSLEEYEYSGILFCYDRSLGSIGSYRIGRIKTYGAYIARR